MPVSTTRAAAAEPISADTNCSHPSVHTDTAVPTFTLALSDVTEARPFTRQSPNP
ncbi:hypothetical protein [Streptomyces sp. NBC_00286]|uniref:hypothetical protein n=1 Tax=Streptomyces sp. NBC_00286 TaxID=2975701 RepID=UPI002E29B913|nr:hypothetical protein [Streptomyces sp. NBC_00286]